MLGTNVEELWPDLSKQIKTTRLMLSEADKQDQACHKFEDKEMAKFFRQIDFTKSHDLVRGAVVCLIYVSGWTGLATDANFYRLLFVKKHQVKPGFTNYQPQGLADQIKFEV